MTTITTSTRSPNTALAVHSATTTNPSQTQTEDTPLLQTLPPVLRLRGAEPGKRKKRIQWANDVIDNEGLGRKSSKVCCIYHAPRSIDESSDESSSEGSSSDDNSGLDKEGARPAGLRRRGHSPHLRSLNREETQGCAVDHPHGKGKRKATKVKARSPNAYEKIPKVKEGSSTG